MLVASKQILTVFLGFLMYETGIHLSM